MDWNILLDLIILASLGSAIYFTVKLDAIQSARVESCRTEMRRLQRSWDEMLLTSVEPYLALMECIREDERTPQISAAIEKLRGVVVTLQERISP